uniref:Uncharacterized protein n=1 Tax=Branchiostoma floridae TaxID=7739 RepID=C3ZKX5_BRAFL|eukprot:XP_002590646.1 hypothetical protein BRAFLDRAFT_89446 [Branchiostoma floridae]
MPICQFNLVCCNMSDLDRFTDLDPIFAQWAQEKLRKKFRRPKYKTLVAVDTKDLSVNHYEETYHREGRKEEVTCNESKEEVENNSDNVMEHMITAADTTKSSYEWSQTKGYKLSASVSVNVGLPEIGGGLLVKGGAEFQLFKKKTKKRETEDSHGHQTKVDVQPWSKVKVSIETKKKVHKMGFSLKFYLQGKVTVQMKKESGKTKTVTGDVVDILQKYGTVETDTSGERTVCLSIEGTFEGMTRIDRKVNVNTTALSTKIDKDTDMNLAGALTKHEVREHGMEELTIGNSATTRGARVCCDDVVRCGEDGRRDQRHPVELVEEAAPPLQVPPKIAR